MPLSTAIEIAAPGEHVWALLTDTRAWPDWGPSVSAVECAERHIQAGSHGRVRTAVGIWLPFRVTAFIDGEFWAWRVAGIPATGHRVTAVAADRCRLSFEVPGLAAPYLAVCRIAVRRIRDRAEQAEFTDSDHHRSNADSG